MTLQTQIDIAAPPRAVWDVLTDFERHPAWNPFIRSISGEVRPGARLEVVLGPPGGRPMTFRPTVTRAEPPDSAGGAFAWLGTLGAGWIFRGEHLFRLEPHAGGTRLHHGEDFGGVLVALMRTSLDTDTRRGFEAMNRALKAHVEAGA